MFICLQNKIIFNNYMSCLTIESIFTWTIDQLTIMHWECTMCMG